MAEAMGMDDGRNRRNRVIKMKPEATTIPAAGLRRARRALGAALLLVAALCLLLTGSASAALKYAKAPGWPKPTGCERQVAEITADKMHNWLWVTCGAGERETGGFGGSRTLHRFNFDGTPANFSASEPYLKENVLLYGPGNPESAIGSYETAASAVDESSSPNSGLFFFNGKGGGFNTASIETLKPSGEWNGNQPFTVAGECCGIDIGPNGEIYVGIVGGGGRIVKYNAAWKEEGRVIVDKSYPQAGPPVLCLRADTTGAIWHSTGTFGGDCGDYPLFLEKFESDQFIPAPQAANIYTELEAEQAGLPPQPQGSPFLEYEPLFHNEFRGFDVDSSNNDLYVNRGDKIEVFTPGTAEDPLHKAGPDIGTGELEYSALVAIDQNHNVYARAGSGSAFNCGYEPTSCNSKDFEIMKWEPVGIIPDVLTKKAEIDDIGHTSALLHGKIMPAGGPPVTECKVEYGKEAGVYTKSAPCNETLPYTSDTEVSANIPKGGDPALVTGATYHYRFVATNSVGTNYGADRSVTPVAVIKLHTLAATGVVEHEATLNGSLDPDGYTTHYYFQYGLNKEYGQSTPEALAGASPGTVSSVVTGLPSGRTFHFRIVARNSLGTTFGPDLSFRTASPPVVSGLTADELTGTSATLHARINPNGYDSEYQFEYGDSPSYGHTVPIAMEDIGSGTESVAVAKGIAGLQEGVTYHFRVHAKNQWNDAYSEDTTFDYSPPSCPNSHVRQQTRSNYLPDCRGYELVTPGDAGAILMLPSDSIYNVDLGGGCAGAGCKLRTNKFYAINTGLAENPPRFAYFAAFGSYADQDATNGIMDMYIASRTPTGWKQALAGIHGHEGVLSSRPHCSEDMSLCTAHMEGEPIYGYPPQIEAAAGLFSVADGGVRIGSLPTNVNAIPEARYAYGNELADELPSGDFSHYAFSSLEHVFAPGGTTEAPGSAYDNNVATKTVKLISKTPAGVNIPLEIEGNTSEVIEFPAVSSDGSHILMSVEGAEGPSHLYMRVNDAITYDVSRGQGVHYVGMTRDGKHVFFEATQQLTPDDTDNSVDLYRWDEEGNTVTRLSTGNGQGNGDGCAPSWGSQCSTEPLDTERGHPFDFLSFPTLDDYIAEESGDVFFYSPESLDPARPGIGNQRNLYDYRNGAAHLVATLDPGTSISRITITPDGHYAGFVTASSLTGYDTHGKKEMYLYNAVAETIQCVSCRPDGLPPSGDVEASQGGPFVSNDGRIFFATKDSLVQHDINEGKVDVYEFTAGRPQLITSGTASRDFTGGTAIVNILQFPKVAHTGLESVSNNGDDVYFTTFDSLVPQDHNGPFVKFYDARVNGGFEPEPEFAGCAAADECHGDGNPAPGTPQIGTSGNLGNSGNLHQGSTHTSHHKKHHKKHHHKRHHNTTGGGRNG